jgi:glutathione S-transferase
MKLYGHDTSPYVRRIRVLLAELGLPFERDANSWSNPDAAVLRLNPLLRVPALTDGELLLLDSKLIATYLYDRYPSSPPAPAGNELPLQRTLWHKEHRYDDENMLLVLDGATDSTINVFLLEMDGLKPAEVPYLSRQLQRVRSSMAWLDEKLAGKVSLHDGAVSFFDLSLVCALQWMQFRDRYPVAQHPNLLRFISAHQDRPSLQATHPSLAQNTALPKVTGK